MKVSFELNFQLTLENVITCYSYFLINLFS